MALLARRGIRPIHLWTSTIYSSYKFITPQNLNEHQWQKKSGSKRRYDLTYIKCLCNEKTFCYLHTDFVNNSLNKKKTSCHPLSILPLTALHIKYDKNFKTVTDANHIADSTFQTFHHNPPNKIRWIDSTVCIWNLLFALKALFITSECL
jgi:hypothetical protein